MPTTFNTVDTNFEQRFRAFLNAREEAPQDVAGAVSDIIRNVKTRGDAALIEYTQKWDWASFAQQHLRVSDADVKRAKKQCAPELKEALKIAAKRIKTYHKKQLPKNARYVDKDGITLGWQWSSLDAVGMYVPGGKASYPSSVLMNAVPAKVAGVKRLVMVVPAPDGEINPAVLTAASLAGVDEIYRVGGAQAVAALAYGTASIAPVDKIVGPGNAFVAEAKRQVFGKVGIDMIAGPSEILVIADNKNDAHWIAADLLSQAEHDAMAQSVLVTTDAAYAEQVKQEVERILATLARAAIARESWEKHGAVFVVKDMEEAVSIANRIAPEHLELAVENADSLLPQIKHAGAVFLGRRAPEALGDYIAGPSHVLPTSGTARFSSVLSVLDFVKRTSIIGCAEGAGNALFAAAETLAHAEGLGAHALSLAVRRGNNRQ